MEAGEREGMVARCADVVLRLPYAAALDARPPVQRIDDTPAEDVRRDRGRRKEEAALRAATNLGLIRGGLPKEKLEAWPCGAKLARRCHREIELQCVRQEKHAVEGRPRFQVDEANRVQLFSKCARPVVENVCDRHTISDPEGQIEV